MCVPVMVLFFFSSRRRHTRYWRDWSSDVCSSDLRSAVWEKKRRRDGLMRLAEDEVDWVVGFLDECWWSRVAQPNLHSFSEEGEPLRLVEQMVEKDDPDPKAISCYGLYTPELRAEERRVGKE